MNRLKLDTVQLNLGRKCNQSCRHCHHSAGPTRTEMMERDTADWIVESLGRLRPNKLDLTGGAPELNPNLRRMILSAREQGISASVRTNLTVYLKEGFRDLPKFFRDNRVELIASLPCYLEENVDRQRGKGTYRKSLEVLRMLNLLGYGDGSSGLVLNLVYNPAEALLSSNQKGLESAYKDNLGRYGVRFDSLYALNNVPIGRFRTTVLAANGYDRYIELLRSSTAAANWDSVMCRSMISVDWQGNVHDCDFNLALKQYEGIGPETKKLWELSKTDILERELWFGDHCLACVAGQGSSCRGALDEAPDASGWS